MRLLIHSTTQQLPELITRLRVTGIDVRAGAIVGARPTIVIEKRDAQRALELLKQFGVVARRVF